ncbi:ABC-2 transporter permease [Kitasatospora sp. NPDC051984]|uniref:ABC-2 transporter permease n=1 Tax=Kitasatospora sp. NPDC051984 TaxID=3364059 RepID=UPI0037C65256
MTALARVTVLHLRTVAPYRAQGLLVFGVMVLVLAHQPARLLPVLAVLLAPLIAVHPFVVADRSGLATLYAVLPVPRRTVLLGHYVWALAGFVATVGAGTAAAVLIARAGGTPLGTHDVLMVLTLCWALFAVNIAIQFPLLIRFGYARVSVLATTLPLVLVMTAVVRLHLTLESVRPWLPLLWPAGLATVALSALLAVRLPEPRPRTRPRPRCLSPLPRGSG